MDGGKSFTSAIQAKGAPLNQCIGFIDWTVRLNAGPTKNQRIMYSGHKRIHSLKFQVILCFYYNLFTFVAFHIQSVVTPNGLIAHLFGPMEGKRHDDFMLSVSGLPNKLRSFTQPNNSPCICVVWRSSIWSVSKHLVSFPWLAHSTIATGVQQSHECRSSDF